MASDLDRFRDHCARQAETAEAMAASIRDTRRRGAAAAARVWDRDAALWKMLAGEVIAYQAGDPDVVSVPDESVESPLF